MHLCITPARASVQARSQRGATCAARAVAAPEVHPRRAALAALPLAALLLTSACAAPPLALARDLAAAEAAKEARKAALRKAAEDSATTGVGEAAFAESEYSIGDDHRCVRGQRCGVRQGGGHVLRSESQKMEHVLCEQALTRTQPGASPQPEQPHTTGRDVRPRRGATGFSLLLTRMPCPRPAA